MMIVLCVVTSIPLLLFMVVAVAAMHTAKLFEIVFSIFLTAGFAQVYYTSIHHFYSQSIEKNLLFPMHVPCIVQCMLYVMCSPS